MTSPPVERRDEELRCDAVASPRPSTAEASAASTLGMIERVKEAITKVEIALPGAGGLRGRLTIAPGLAREIARAAIAAMREPTEAMHAAGWNVGMRTPPGEDPTLPAWQAMIDAALSESP